MNFDELKRHRPLTEKEVERMMDAYASGPLDYKPGIDDPLFELDLLQFYDSGSNPKAVEPKHETDYFYAENGSVLAEWWSR